jgi:uncharacterized membrane protein
MDMFLNHEDNAPKISMNGRQKLFICAIDLLILLELCVAMARATAVAPELFTATFMKTFFVLFLPTLGTGIAGFRKLRDRVENA